ncbi:hypothetical protein VIGAN_05110600, partial [Vigna angularis var. angularis]
MAAPTFLLLFSLFIFLSLIFCSASSPLGYGYTISSLHAYPKNNSFIAHLNLIKPSSLFGPDIPHLSLHASFENKDRFRLRITDSNNKRWEIPQHLIPRVSPSQYQPLRHLHGSPQALSLTHPDSDLVFTLHNTTPFGFTLSRKSSNDVLFNAAPDPSNPQ